MQTQMTPKVAQMVRDFLSHNHGDQERTARWMRDTLRLGGIKFCREVIRAAVAA